MKETYRRIDRENLSTGVNMREMGEERRLFVRNQKLFADMRTAYAREQITRQELLTLRGQIKAGDAEGARNGLGRLLERSGAYV
jgi:hypothetical protein